MLDSSVKTSTRGTLLATGGSAGVEGIDVPLIIDGGAIYGASPARGRIRNMPGTRGRWWRCWMRLSEKEGDETSGSFFAWRTEEIIEFAGTTAPMMGVAALFCLIFE